MSLKIQPHKTTNSIGVKLKHFWVYNVLVKRECFPKYQLLCVNFSDLIKIQYWISFYFPFENSFKAMGLDKSSLARPALQTCVCNLPFLSKLLPLPSLLSPNSFPSSTPHIITPLFPNPSLFYPLPLQALYPPTSSQLSPSYSKGRHSFKEN